MRKTTPTPCLLVLLLLPVCACSSSTATGTAPSDGFPAPSKEFVYDVAADVLRKQGLAPSREASSKQTWTIVTHWKNSPAPFSGTGYRERATLTVLDVPGRPGYYFTETQVARQTNDNMTDPSNMLAADWGDENRCGEREMMINNQIELQFLPGDVSQDFRRRYGMPEQDPDRIDSRTLPCPQATPAPAERYP